MTTVKDLVEAYMHYLRGRRAGTDSRPLPCDWEWAWEEVTDLVRDRPEVAWEIISSVVERANESELGLVATSPEARI